MRRWGAFKRIKQVAAALGCAAFAHCAGAATLTPDEARRMAQIAYTEGKLELANALARALVEARPKDTEALLIYAATETKLGRGAKGREIGRLAYRLSEDKRARRQAAYVTSEAAARNKHYTAAQWWLRRAYHHSEGESEKAQVARAFRQVRAANPWSAQVDLAVRPSSNVTGGTDATHLQVDDGIEFGSIREASRAQSGIQSSAMLRLSRRLSQSAAHRTELSYLGVRTWVSLDDDVHGIEGSDYAAGLAEISLSYRTTNLPAPLPDHIQITLGQHWAGREPSQRVGRLLASRTFTLGEATSLRVTGQVERRLRDDGGQDRDGTSLTVDLTHRVGPGVAQLRLSRNDVRSDFINADYTGFGARLSYTQSESLHGLRFSGSLHWRERSYDEHSGNLDENNQPSVVARQDETHSASLSMHMERFAFLGFEPVVTYAAQKTESNFSVYRSRSYGWSLGLRSSF